MIFKFNYHNQILEILESFDREVLVNSCAYFGGGSLIALNFGEYRWSKDIDFICSVSTSGYKSLRTIIFDGGYEALFHDRTKIKIGRGTSNQYGIRMVVNIEDIHIKTEIIAESRFELDPPIYPKWSPVPCLNLNDCFTSKLLANSDRFMDDSVEARDLIDLAVLRLQSGIPQKAIAKAERAYEVIRPLKVAIQRFQERVDFRARCFTSLQIEDALIPRIIDGIDLLAADVGLSDTKRTFREQHDIF